MHLSAHLLDCLKLIILISILSLKCLALHELGSSVIYTEHHPLLTEVRMCWGISSPPETSVIYSR